METSTVLNQFNEIRPLFAEASDCTVFVRNWWKIEKNQLIPHLGRKTFLAYNVTESEACEICKEYNNTHNPGKLSRKAEYTSK